MMLNSWVMVPPFFLTWFFALSLTVSSGTVDDGDPPLTPPAWMGRRRP
jgi:hypothetical protein